MGWLVWLASVLWVGPLFWWCCCGNSGPCSFPCCRSNTTPPTETDGTNGFEFIFTNFPTNTDFPWAACPGGGCEAFYNGVSIILDYGDTPGGTGPCTWRGLGANYPGIPLTCASELPDIMVSASCTDRRTFRISVGAGTYGGGRSGNSSGGGIATITSATDGDVICDTIASGTLSSGFPTVNGCHYNGATFTIQAIP